MTNTRNLVERLLTETRGDHVADQTQRALLREAAAALSAQDTRIPREPTEKMRSTAFNHSEGFDGVTAADFISAFYDILDAALSDQPAAVVKRQTFETDSRYCKHCGKGLIHHENQRFCPSNEPTAVGQDNNDAGAAVAPQQRVQASPIAPLAEDGQRLTATLPASNQSGPASPQPADARDAEIRQLREALEAARTDLLRIHGCYPLPYTRGRPVLEQIDAILGYCFRCGCRDEHAPGCLAANPQEGK